MELQNLKVIINNKRFDIDGYSLSRRVYFLLDGRVVGFDEAEAVLRGTGVTEYEYNKFELANEIFEGDKIKFFDNFNNILTGKAVYDDNRLQWIIICDKNIYGWEEYALCESGCPTIIYSGE
jgi:hypothetical protein